MGKACTIGKHGVQERLEEELKRLQQATGMVHSLRVAWRPSVDNSLSGEVKGEEVIIYECDESEALQVLRHEVIDFLVSHAIEPYKNVTNALIKVVNEAAYERKEKVVEAINRLVAETT
jgi:hypothetical protein